MSDFYKTLGVNKNASKEEIKKAFHKLAGKHHPDRGGSEQKFKEINEAYQTLSNDARKAEYDNHGQTFSGRGQYSSGGFTGQGWDFSHMGDFSTGGESANAGGVEFDLGEMFNDFFSGRSRTQTKRGSDISIDIEITFEESIFGIERKVLVTKKSACVACAGSGTEKGSGYTNCMRCQGRGTIKDSRRSIFGTIVVENACPECEGLGKTPNVKCKQCKGLGIQKQPTEIKIGIPAGIENGEMIRLSGYGEYEKAGRAGDLYVKIHVRPHPIFKREGTDISIDLMVKLTDAILGARYKISSLEGDLDLEIKAGTNNGDVIRIAGRGVPFGRGKRGNLIVRMILRMPNKLSHKAIEAITQLREEGI